MVAVKNPSDILSSHNFIVQVDAATLGIQGSERVGFTTVGIIRGDAEVISVKEITDLVEQKTFPGRMKYAPVRMTRGVDTDGTLVRWWAKISTFNVLGPPENFKADIQIFPVSSSGNEFNDQLGIRLVDAWPSSFEFGPWDASVGGFLIHAAMFQYSFFGITGL